MKRSVFLLAVVFTVVTNGATQSCYEEAKTLCGGAGHGPIRACLRENFSNFSAACKAKAEQLRPHWRKSVQACREDAKKFCADVAPGQGRKVECLVNRFTKGEALSSDCGAAVNLLL